MGKTEIEEEMELEITPIITIPKMDLEVIEVEE